MKLFGSSIDLTDAFGTSREFLTEEGSELAYVCRASETRYFGVVLVRDGDVWTCSNKPKQLSTKLLIVILCSKVAPSRVLGADALFLREEFGVWAIAFYLRVFVMMCRLTAPEILLSVVRFLPKAPPPELLDRLCFFYLISRLCFSFSSAI